MPTSPISVSAWATLDDGSTQRNIVSKGYNGTNTQFSLLNVGSKPSFQSFDGSPQGVTATSDFSATEFKFIAGTFDGTTYRIYVNGVLEGAQAAAAPVATNQAVMIGAVDTSAIGILQFWLGKILDVRVYNRVLADADVWAMYDPVSRWDLYWQPTRRLFVNLPAGGGSPLLRSLVMEGGMTGGMLQ